MKIKAWHFSTGRLGNGDGRKIVKKRTLKVIGTPLICARGLHASVRASHALSYAPGSMVSRVLVSGLVMKGFDKIVGTERHCLWIADASETLMDFSRWCALDVVKFWAAPNVVIEFLNTGNRDCAAEAQMAAWTASDARNERKSKSALAAWMAASKLPPESLAIWAMRYAKSAWLECPKNRNEEAKNFDDRANRKLTSMLNKLEK